MDIRERRRTQRAGAEGRGRGRGRTRETRRAETRRNRDRVAGTRGNFRGHAARTSWTDLNKRHLFKGNSKTTKSGREKRKTLLSRKKALTDLFQKIRQIASLKFPCHFQGNGCVTKGGLHVGTNTQPARWTTKKRNLHSRQTLSESRWNMQSQAAAACQAGSTAAARSATTGGLGGCGRKHDLV